MASNSDHGINRTNIIDLLPDVYRSDINKTLLDASFNKFLTKSDTHHVAGIIGQSNAAALISRQLTEPTPHRQAFQLAPVMYSKSGTNDTTLTFKGFQQQLSLMGVDITGMDNWAQTERFNWIPPVNPDMLINYADYFWKPKVGQSAPQHFTIENRCVKATSKLNAYKAIIARRGATIDVVRIDFAKNAFIIASKHDDLFVDEFMFNTKGTTNINIANKSWLAVSSSYDGNTDETTIVVTPSLAISTNVIDTSNPPAPPTAMYEGQWWYKFSSNPLTPLNQLFTWTGTNWAITSQTFPCVISLSDQESVYQSEVNCACSSDTGGWDARQWDDNQKGSLLWNTELLADISWNTEAEWIAHNTQTSPMDLWYDLTTLELKQRTADNTAWIVVLEHFDTTTAETTGTTLWDASVGCTLQEYNQWSAQNEWVHKSELTTFVGAKRAQVPILEYSSQTELNEWTKVTYQWKYRAEQSKPFEITTAAPNRLELEPIKSYVAANVGGIWYLYLSTEQNSANRDIDYSSVFTNGYKFRIVDKQGLNMLFTSAGAIHREIGDTDPTDVPRARFTTVVELRETDFLAPTLAGPSYETTLFAPVPPYTRIEPTHTSTGDQWRGYHNHWLLDTNTSTAPTSAAMLNPFIKRSATAPALTISLPTGGLYVTETYQEFTPTLQGITLVDLHSSFWFNPSIPRYYAIPGENAIRVYINGVRQYGTYTEIQSSNLVSPDYTTVDAVDLQGSITTSTSFRYINAIQFQHPLAVTDVVRIEVAPASYYDMGLYSVPVRTVEDDVAFKAGVVQGTQPAYKNLSQYRRTEQNKTSINQYPVFNIYDIVSGNVVKTSPIFSFVEDSSYDVNSSTQRRIAATTDGKEYIFEQSLVDVDNGVMFAYRNITEDTLSYWYNPLTSTLKKWDGKAWADTILSNTPTGLIAYKPVVSSAEPTTLLNQHRSVWVDPATLTFRERDAINGMWVQLDGDVNISSADPTLQTIWKTSNTQPNYTPQYVGASGTTIRDADNAYGLKGTTINKGDGDGDWEVVSQWKNNPEHENHKQIKLSQLITHMTSIVSLQPRVPGLSNRGIFTLRQQDYNFGVGGTIKEHNGAFDTLISAINVSETTPVGIIEFAQEQYESNMVVVRDIFNANIIDLLINNSGQTAQALKTTISDFCINSFASNDFMSAVYGDTTAYNQQSWTGMPNWIATAPMFGLAPKTRPHLISDGSSSILVHHDGHRSVISYSAAEQDRIARNIVKIFNKTNPGAAVISPSQPTGSILPVFWYYTGPGLNAIYKLKSSQPVVWELIDIADILGHVFLTIEDRLYAASPDFPIPVFDFASLTTTPAQQAVYADRVYNRFMDFVSVHNIKAPLINTGYTLTDPLTWNYAQSTLDTPPTTRTVTPAGCWQALYESWYGTPYPHLEPWCLQGYTEKPLWWDAEYADDTETRRWKYDHATQTGMWENIRLGTIPSGYAYPNGTISTGSPSTDGVTIPSYAYFSVNISDTVIAGGYAPDALLPPYYDISPIAATLPTVRSLFRDFTTQIIAPSSDYAFGDRGPTEWAWLTSGEHVYDRSIIAFLMQPVAFLDRVFGPTHVTVGQLNVDLITKKVYNHKEAMFHGDVYATNTTYTANGLNQWYVNFNRFNGFDSNITFRNAWTTWKPYQSYQTAGIVDTSTLQLFNKTFDVTNKDYSVILANSGVLSERWLDAFDVSVINIPSAVIQYNNQSLWKFSVDTLAPVSRALEYYGVQLWPVLADRDTNTFAAFSYNVAGVTASVNTFIVRGNQTPFFIPGVSITVEHSTTNDGVYTILRSTYDTVNNTTNVKVVENVATSTVDGTISITDYAHNWSTGDMVAVTCTSLLPYPIQEQRAYYIIKVDARHFQLAENAAYATAGVVVDISSVPTGDVTIGKVASTFQIYNGASNNTDVWFHYALNKADVRTFNAPETVVGMQSLINLIDGYKNIQEDRGVVFNRSADIVEYDSDTGQPVTWQLETERFMDWAYNLRRSRLQLNDRFDFVVSNQTDNTLRFTSAAPSWASGTTVALSTSGTLPSPLLANTPYYIAPTADPQVFKLCVTKRLAEIDVVDITTTGSGNMFVSTYKKEQAFPSFEINPSRNNIWFATPQGMLSNVLSGPYADIRVSQSIYDQYGRRLTADKLAILREDLMNRVSVTPAIPNDVQLPVYGVDDPYSNIHIGGGHFFTEGYEHIIMFNNYSVGSDLIYDPFLGLAANRFDIDYYEKAEYTMRPTLGGYYLTGNLFKRNIEGSIEDMRRFYDAFELTEGTTEAQYARHLLGYHPTDGSMSFLDLLNTNSKSQFLFYRGMIQMKGSVNSINAFINSKKFVDAKMDEFWAYKIADFGDSRPKMHPKIRLHSTDIVRSDIRLKFALQTDTDLDSTADRAKGFETVSFGNGDRWVDFPQQREEIASPLFLDATVSSMTRFYTTQSTTDGLDLAPLNGQNTIDLWIHNQNGTPIIRSWNGIEWTASTTDFRVNFSGQTTYLKLNAPCDGVRVLRQRLTSPGNLLSYRTELMNESDYVNGYTRVNSEIIKFGSTTYTIAGITNTAQTTTLSIAGEAANRFVIGDTVFVIDASHIVLNAEYDPALDQTLVTIDGLTTATAGTPVTHYGFSDILIVFMVTPSVDKINTARLYDTKSHVKIDDIPLWHPAYGIHSPRAIHNVDIQSSVDPARYSVTDLSSSISTNPWLSPETGTTWLDTSRLGYMPYYDDIIMPDIDDRLHAWGTQPDWSSTKVYQWVETLTPPTEWDKVAAKQQNDITIQQADKVTGTPRKTALKRMRTRDTIAVVVGELGFVQQTTFTNTLSDTQPIYLSVDGDLPKTVEAGIPYYVSQYNATTKEFIIVDYTGAAVDVSSVTSMYFTVAFTENWIRKPQVRERTFAAMEFDFTETVTSIYEPTIALTTGQIVAGDEVDVYVNGKRLSTGKVVSGSTVSMSGTGYVMSPSDIIDVVRPYPFISPAQLAFNPIIDEDGTTLVQWSESIEYSQTTRTIGGIAYQYYYFWVEGVTTSRRPTDNQTISSQAVADQLTVIPTPYMIVQTPVDDLWARGYDVPPYDMVGYDGIQYTAYNNDHQFLPQIFYRKAVLTKVSQYVTEDNRYVVEFTRDLTLRNTLETDHNYMNVKNQHEKWFMFRRNQIAAVPHDLWIKMTEALMECRYNDFSVRVPSFEREHYDLVNGTETKYGLETDQIFVNPEFARATLISYLQDPSHDFKPVDVNKMFERFPMTQPAFWKNPAAVKELCDYIFTTFDSAHTNGIWFDILSDALVTKAKYKGLMKTSWLALHGIRILDVGGAFDDY